MTLKKSKNQKREEYEKKLLKYSAVWKIKKEIIKEREKVWKINKRVKVRKNNSWNKRKVEFEKLKIK